MSDKNKREVYRNRLRKLLSGGKTEKREEQSSPPARTGVNMGELCRKLGERLKDN